MDSVRCRTAERFPTRKQSFRFPGMSGTNTERYRTINHSNLLFEIVMKIPFLLISPKIVPKIQLIKKGGCFEYHAVMADKRRKHQLEGVR